jgi:mono/diheme cytochrome c family protein
MKFRNTLPVILITILSACNVTLAEDVTPPPDYIPPTALPTLVLVPPQIPNVANGEEIYFEKCAACHGETGLGDGAQGIQLGVTVPAFALPEIARPASPAAWYTIVTRGKIERFMPPFVSLNDQERWDVVAYIMTLHTSQGQVQKGKEIFEANCQDCSTDFYKDAGKTSGLSTVALARIIRLGNDEIQAFGEDLSDEDMWAVAEYLRSLTYDTTSPAQSIAVPEVGTPVGTEQAEVPGEAVPGFGTVNGSIENKTGAKLPSDLTVTLRGYEHDPQDPNAGPQEVLTLNSTVDMDGSFTLENVELPEGRIFLAEVTYKGIQNSSDFTVVDVGQTSINLPPVIIYDVTQDISGLVVDELDIFLTTTTEGKYEILTLYSFRNTGESVVYVEMKNSLEIPFLKFPRGARGIGYEAMQDSAPFTSIKGGFAMPPNESPYGIIAFSSAAIEKEIAISQPLILPVSVARVFVPEGVKVESNQLTPDSLQDIQGNRYQSYIGNNLLAGDEFPITISSAPGALLPPTDVITPNSTLLIGAAGLGIALILAGAWMYLRDKTQPNNDEDEESDFDTAEHVMDAIISLDDLHRVNKISEAAYQKRRAELKEMLKELV